MGAVVGMKRPPRNAYEESIIAIGGPLLGSVGAGALALVGAATGSQLCLSLADFGFVINLFNLLPLGSLDGGRITGALSPWFGVAGLGLGGALIATGSISNPLFYLIMLSGFYTTGSRFFSPTAAKDLLYYRLSNSQKSGIGAAYFGLIGALVLAMRENNKRRRTPRQL